MDLSDKENHLYPSISKNLLKIIYEENIVCFDQKIAFFENGFFCKKNTNRAVICIRNTYCSIRKIQSVSEYIIQLLTRIYEDFKIFNFLAKIAFFSRLFSWSSSIWAKWGKYGSFWEIIGTQHIFVLLPFFCWKMFPIS